MKKFMVIMVTGMVSLTFMSGCGKESAPAGTATEAAAQTAESVEEEMSLSAGASEVLDSIEDDIMQTASGEVYFTKGVYVNYAKEAENPDKTYFYVFNGADYGYTEDGTTGTGVPFDCTQGDGEVTFSFGGADSYEDILKITSKEDGKITGAFEDGLELVFERVDDADADNFSAENYVNGPEKSVYHDANGWSIKYNANDFEINRENGNVFIVYTGESAGTNMITVTYTVEDKAEAAIKKLGESWGSDKTSYSEAPFLGNEDITGYWAILEPDTEGSGAYETALGRDYMDGALIFDISGHNGNDDAQNMAVSDALSGIIDSITFDQE